LGKSSLVNDYSKILVRRNKILKIIKNDESQKQDLLGWLESLTEIFLLKSLELTENRIKTLKALAPYLSQVIKELSLNREKVDLEYQISGIQCLNLKDEKIREIMLHRRAELLQAELSSGISLWGPHRHEIQFLVQGKDARSFCSQGQQRTLILALKIAQILHYKATHSAFPVLLLDDVLSELDSEKRNSLIKYLSQLETQVFLTTTDQTLLGNLGNVSTKIMYLTVDKFEN
jgi:DNA replication and repair protein RecF